MNRTWALGAAVLTFVLPRYSVAQATRTLVIDATGAPPPVQTGFLRQGTNTSPTGHTIGVTSRYLTRDGKPWLAVMGEFHFSRYPRAGWEDEILKMKAGGVEVVAAYVIWIHHEEIEGRFDWTGSRDLRAFVELCAKHGMYVYPRIGPWSHAEVRNGGFPDWLPSGAYFIWPVNLPMGGATLEYGTAQLVTRLGHAAVPPVMG